MRELYGIVSRLGVRGFAHHFFDYFETVHRLEYLWSLHEKKTDEWIYRYTNYFPDCLLFNLNLKSQFLHA